MAEALEKNIRWHYTVDAGDCILCASCSSIAPCVFHMESSGVVILRQPHNMEEVNLCEAAVINCPTDAIKRNPL
jgi:ferredoxin